MLGIIIDDDAQHHHMPDYRFLIEGDNVLIRRKDVVAEIEGRTEPGGTLRLEPETIAEARVQAPGWDVYHLESEWRAWVVAKGIGVKDPDRHFLSFCRKRGPAR